MFLILIFSFCTQFRNLGVGQPTNSAFRKHLKYEHALRVFVCEVRDKAVPHQKPTKNGTIGLSGAWHRSSAEPRWVLSQSHFLKYAHENFMPNTSMTPKMSNVLSCWPLTITNMFWPELMLVMCMYYSTSTFSAEPHVVFRLVPILKLALWLFLVLSIYLIYTRKYVWKRTSKTIMVWIYIGLTHPPAGNNKKHIARTSFPRDNMICLTIVSWSKGAFLIDIDRVAFIDAPYASPKIRHHKPFNCQV